jgi:serine/threonine-protein kinase HipA
MENLCQATGRLTEDKYRGSLEQAGKAIRRYSDQPGLDAEDFFELVVFCFLTGNADMNLKNFSLWRPAPGNIQLAPAYDLVATQLVLPRDPEESALALNGKKQNLRRKDFDALAESLELREKVRDNVYAKLSAIRRHWEGLRDRTFLGREHRKEFTGIIAERSKRLGLG